MNKLKTIFLVIFVIMILASNAFIPIKKIDHFVLPEGNSTFYANKTFGS